MKKPTLETVERKAKHYAHLVLEECIQNIFLDIQDEYDIQSGDTDIGDAIKLDDLTGELSTLISEIILYQYNINR